MLSWKSAGKRFNSTLALQSSVFSQLGLDKQDVLPGVFDGKSWKASGEIVESINPASGQPMAKIQLGTKEDMQRCIENANAAKEIWRNIPAPRRGDIVRQLGDALRAKLKPLGSLVSLEMGKISAEGVGEVQEYVDICDFSLGLSRTLQGLYLPSERKDHSLIEVYNPLGTVGIITAFNFPNAVAGWNSAISLVCGNTQVIKGSETSNLVNIATQNILNEVLKANGIDSRVATLCQGIGRDIGDTMLESNKVDLVSFTGSTETGRHVQRTVSDRFGKVLLELGGNNAIIVSDKIDEKLMQNALRSVLFAAVGTCGQRCTSLRRLIVHEQVYEEFKEKLTKLYNDVNASVGKKIGDPTKKETLVGPLHSKAQVAKFEQKVKESVSQGGNLISGGRVLSRSELPAELQGGNFVLPALIETTHDKPIVFEENFMPILHLIKCGSVEEGMKLNNSVEQGLSSALFTNDMKEVFAWMGPNGSDTGIVNVNTGCSGAEIGGAFGGNKQTGWGRESGSDAWKQYMRRSTCTVNYGTDLPLAQGIDFS